MSLKHTLRAAADVLPKRHLARLIRRFYTPPRRVQNWLRVEGAHRVEVDAQSSFQMLDDSRLFWNGLYGGHDEHLLRLWVRLCRSARVIFDVGAFRGVLALTAAAANPQAQVFAFEPVGLHHQMIMRNIALNPLGYEFYLIDEHQGAVRQPVIRRKSKYSRDYLLCPPDVAQSLNLK